MSEVFETDDPELAEQVLSEAYASVRIDASGEQHGIRITRSMAGPVRLDHDIFMMSMDAHGIPVGVLPFGHLRSGQLSYASDGGERLYRPGDAFLALRPGHDWAAQVRNIDLELAIVPPDLPSQVAAAQPGRRPQPVRITGYEPVSPQAAQLWISTYAYVRDTVLANPEAAAQPLVAAGAARLLAAVTLTAFPSNALTDPTVTDRHDAHPATLRRAIAFIDDNARNDITVADIAAAARVTIRALQFAFRRHLDLTPMQYLRQARLERARDDLRTADPARVTVTDVAYRWGFPSPGRFSSYYRQAYGVTPSQALRRD